MREGLSRALNGHGLLTHEIVEAVHMSEALGVSIDLKAGVVCSTATRLNRLRRALRRIVRGRPVSSPAAATISYCTGSTRRRDVLAMYTYVYARNDETRGCKMCH